LFPYFAAGIVGTGGKFAIDTSNTRETAMAKFAAGVGAGAPPVANLPPVVHLDLRISPRTFEKNL
jgi:hypothetical protein